MLSGWTPTNEGTRISMQESTRLPMATRHRYLCKHVDFWTDVKYIYIWVGVAPPLIMAVWTQRTRPERRHLPPYRTPSGSAARLFASRRTADIRSQK